jgi:histidine triad (HIT) family protein
MPTTSPDCPFCRIARGLDRSCEVVADGAHWVAFFPPEPATLGHTLIIPRDHESDFWSLQSDLAAELALVAQRLGRAIAAALEPNGMNLITSAGRAAEQSVFHAHLHLLPRIDADRIEIWPDRQQQFSPALLTDSAALIREHFKG